MRLSYQDVEDVEEILMNPEALPKEEETAKNPMAASKVLSMVLGVLLAVLGLAAIVGFAMHPSAGSWSSSHSLNSKTEEKVVYPAFSPGDAYSEARQDKDYAHLTFGSKCVGVNPADIKKPGAVVQLRPCWEKGNIDWEFIPAIQDYPTEVSTDGKLAIYSVFGPHMCLDVKDHNFQDGTPLQLWPCTDGDDDQLLNRADSDHGDERRGLKWWQSFSRWQWTHHPEFFIDVRDGKTEDWTPVQIWHHGPNQDFI